MPDAELHAFVPLSVLLRQGRDPEPPPIVAEEAVRSPDDDSHEFGEVRETIADVRRFRAALADAFDAALHGLLTDLAAEVLVRELTVAPCDVAAIAASALRRLDEEPPLRVRAHPEDIGALADIGCERCSDPTLRRGDVCIDVRSGTIDASLGVRLEAVLLRNRG